MHKISKEQLDTLVSYFTGGNGSNLPYKEVARILQILLNLPEVTEQDEKTKKS